MADAKVTTEFVTKETVTLTLTKTEARVLQSLIGGHVTGYSDLKNARLYLKNARLYTDRIWEALHKAGVVSYLHDPFENVKIRAKDKWRPDDEDN